MATSHTVLIFVFLVRVFLFSSPEVSFSYRFYIKAWLVGSHCTVRSKILRYFFEYLTAERICVESSLLVLSFPYVLYPESKQNLKQNAADIRWLKINNGLWWQRDYPFVYYFRWYTDSVMFGSEPEEKRKIKTPNLYNILQMRKSGLYIYLFSHIG